MNKIFIVGSPRSGTTWLQLLLSQHPSIATCQETHFFSGYMGPLFKQWNRENRINGERQIGLKSILTEEEFIEMCRRSGDYLFDQIAAKKPESTWILEKTPVHIKYTNVIRALYPEARFIHLVRDPRSVVASLKAASVEWGKSWKEMELLEFAELWVESVNLGNSLAKACRNTAELRYEDLKNRPAEELRKLFEWLNLSSEEFLFENAVARTQLEKLKDPQEINHKTALPWSTSSEPQGFFRDGSLDGWRKDLKPYEIFLIEKLARLQMATYGYQPECGYKPGTILMATVEKARQTLISKIRRIKR